MKTVLSFLTTKKFLTNKVFGLLTSILDVGMFFDSEWSYKNKIFELFPIMKVKTRRKNIYDIFKSEIDMNYISIILVFFSTGLHNLSMRSLKNSLE